VLQGTHLQQALLIGSSSCNQSVEFSEWAQATIRTATTPWDYGWDLIDKELDKQLITCK